MSEIGNIYPLDDYNSLSDPIIAQERHKGGEDERTKEATTSGRSSGNLTQNRRFGRGREPGGQRINRRIHMTAAITTAITNASMNVAIIAAAAATDVRTATKSVESIYSSIYPFDNLSTDMNMRDGKALWYTITRMPSAWPKAGVAVTMANAEDLQDLI